VVIRAERGVVDLEKDRAKQDQVTAAAGLLDEMIDGLTPAVSAEKREAVEEFHWLVEEFKVSVFAQELGTAAPVSAKRLRQRADKIGRML
jgi:ATP-dependent helicase HrpA